MKNWMTPSTVLAVATSHKVANWRVSPTFSFRIVFVDPSNCKAWVRVAVDGVATTPKANTFCSGLYMVLLSVLEIVLRVSPWGTRTMIQEVTELLALLALKERFQRSPVIVPGNALVNRRVATFEVVHVWLTTMRDLSIGLLAARMVGMVLARLRDIIGWSRKNPDVGLVAV